MEKSNAFGIIITLILLNIAMIYGYKMVILNLKDTIKSNEITLEDKNTKYVSGDNVILYDEENGEMERLEILLTTQVQDYEMPEPKKLSIDDETINITSMYQVDLISYANSVWEKIKSNEKEQKYEIKYDFGTWNGNNETYRIYEKG